MCSVQCVLCSVQCVVDFAFAPSLRSLTLAPGTSPLSIPSCFCLHFNGVPLIGAPCSAARGAAGAGSTSTAAGVAARGGMGGLCENNPCKSNPCENNPCKNNRRLGSLYSIIEYESSTTSSSSSCQNKVLNNSCENNPSENNQISYSKCIGFQLRNVFSLYNPRSHYILVYCTCIWSTPLSSILLTRPTNPNIHVY